MQEKIKAASLKSETVKRIILPDLLDKKTRDKKKKRQVEESDLDERDVDVPVGKKSLKGRKTHKVDGPVEEKTNFMVKLYFEQAGLTEETILNTSTAQKCAQYVSLSSSCQI